MSRPTVFISCYHADCHSDAKVLLTELARATRKKIGVSPIQLEASEESSASVHGSLASDVASEEAGFDDCREQHQIRTHWVRAQPPRHKRPLPGAERSLSTPHTPS